MAIFSDGTTYGKGLAEEFKKAILSLQLPADEAGAKTKGSPQRVAIVAEAVIPLINEGKIPDYGGLLDPLISLQPDMIYFGGNYPEGAVLVRQVKERKLAAVFMAGDAIANSVFIKMGGIAAEGIFYTFGPAVEDMPQAGRFYGAFKARYGELGPYSIYSYDAANVLLESIVKAGVTSGDSLVKVLHSSKFSGALGDIEFDAKGDIKISPYVIWTVKGAEFIPYKSPQTDAQ